MLPIRKMNNKLKNLVSNQTLRTKLTLWLLFVSLVPLITAGYFTYSYTIKIVKKEVINNINEITEKKAKQIK